MTTLALENVPDDLLARLKKLAHSDRKTVSEEAMKLLEERLREREGSLLTDQELMARIDAAHAGGLDEDDKKLLDAARKRGRKMLADDKW